MDRPEFELQNLPLPIIHADFALTCSSLTRERDRRREEWALHLAARIEANILKEITAMSNRLEEARGRILEQVRVVSRRKYLEWLATRLNDHGLTTRVVEVSSWEGLVPVIYEDRRA